MTSPETMNTDQLLERMVSVIKFVDKPDGPVWHARAVGVFDFAHADTPREAMIEAANMQDRQKLAAKAGGIKPPAVVTEPAQPAGPVEANADLF